MSPPTATPDTPAQIEATAAPPATPANRPTGQQAETLAAQLTAATPSTPAATVQQPPAAARTGVPNTSGQIVDQNVLNSLAQGDTAGFIRTLGGNVQSSLNNATDLLFQITG